MSKNKFRALVKDEQRMITDSQDFIPLKVTSHGVLRLSAKHKESLYSLLSIDNFELTQYTGYTMNETDLYFGDLVSNNFKTGKEVIREIVEHKGCKMMKRVKGNSSLPKFISLHDHHKLNYKIIGNVYQDKELLK